MKNENRLIYGSVLVLILAFLAACGGGAPAEPEPEAFIPDAQQGNESAAVLDEGAAEEVEAVVEEVVDEPYPDPVVVVEEAVDDGYPAPEEAVAEEPAAEEEAAEEEASEEEVVEEEMAEAEVAEETEETEETQEAEAVAEEADSAGTATFTIDSAQSQVSYSVEEEFFNREVQFVTAIGTTSEIDGGFAVDLSGEAPALAGGEINVDISTLQSDSNRRDTAIQNDWLESASFPIATFIPTEITNYVGDYTAGEVSFVLSGNLTVRDVTNPIDFEVTATLVEGVLDGTATTFLLMEDYGFEPPNILNILEVTDGVTLTIDLVAQQS